MINYLEKGRGLHKAIAEAGQSLYRIDSNWVSSDDVAVQAIIDTFDPLPKAKAAAIAEIAQFASALIDKNVNPIKARRIQADATLASSKKANGKPLSAAGVGMLNRFETVMVYPQAIFAQYDIEEARIIAETNWQSMDEAGAKARLEAI